MGDCLVVCLNSDASVRRLKGPERPIIAEADRVQLLTALECVDAVLVFEEDTPAEVLGRLAPDVWVKGGDHRDGPLPEASVVAAGGGVCVSVPYHPARSSSALVAALAAVG
jgi:rfaE bifunctional protein nucleotidyltransferase chain/domain